MATYVDRSREEKRDRIWKMLQTTMQFAMQSSLQKQQQQAKIDLQKDAHSQKLELQKIADEKAKTFIPKIKKFKTSDGRAIDWYMDHKGDMVTIDPKESKDFTQHRLEETYPAFGRIMKERRAQAQKQEKFESFPTDTKKAIAAGTDKTSPYSGFQVPGYTKPWQQEQDLTKFKALTGRGKDMVSATGQSGFGQPKIPGLGTVLRDERQLEQDELGLKQDTFNLRKKEQAAKATEKATKAKKFVPTTEEKQRLKEFNKLFTEKWNYTKLNLGRDVTPEDFTATWDVLAKQQGVADLLKQVDANSTNYKEKLPATSSDIQKATKYLTQDKGISLEKIQKWASDNKWDIDKALMYQYNQHLKEDKKKKGGR